MEFSFTEEQKLIKDAARDFLEKECPSDLVRAMEEDERGYSPELWRKMAELGWFRLIFPEKYGGFEGDFLDLVVLLEEMGRYLAPVPFLPTVILGGLPILAVGTEKQKQEVLPKIAKGELILSGVFAEPTPMDGAAGTNLRAIREGDDFLILGTKLFVPYAHVADYLVCAARTGEEREGGGITLFLIKGGNPSISCTMLKTVACEKQCEVIFDRVRVTEESIIGEYNKGWEILREVLEKGGIAECALMVGGAEKVLDMTVTHAKKRVQFGRPIGSFQAIQHRCANMKVDLDGARFATYEAAWKMSRGIPCTLEVSVAKAWVNQAYNRICANGHQIHGGSGVMKDYDMELYSRRAKAAEFFLGDTDFHREIVAKQLGL
jgi:alkylation response protein AidB-like acyl-CoA dehydrogenase